MGVPPQDFPPPPGMEAKGVSLRDFPWLPQRGAEGHSPPNLSACADGESAEVRLPASRCSGAPEERLIFAKFQGAVKIFFPKRLLKVFCWISWEKNLSAPAELKFWKAKFHDFAVAFFARTFVIFSNFPGKILNFFKFMLAKF